MKLLLKVCGMREAENIQEVAKLSPDLMGFIFYSKSKRYVGEDFQAPVLDGLKKVGVFVNEKPERVLGLAKRNQLDYIQLHGEESVEEARALKKGGFGVIKVIGILDKLPIEILSDFEGAVDYFLFDTKTPEYGGSGQHFDWTILKKYPFTTPYLLSGGIDVQDIETIKEMNLPGLAGIDVNSKVELAPGLKDIRKVKELNVQIG